MNKAFDLAVMLIAVVFVMVLNQVLGVHYLVAILIMVPFLLIFFVSSAIMYNSRADLKPETIPADIFNDRIQNLNQIAIQLKEKDFERIDDFLLPMMPLTLVYIFRHKEQPCYFCLYEIGNQMAMDIITFFNNDYGITSTISPSGGNLPRSDKKLLQIFTDVHQDELIAKHIAGVEFLKTKGLKPVMVDDKKFREKFMESMAETWKTVKKNIFWPIMVLIWSIPGRGKKYMKPVEQQFSDGTIIL
ncbi:MAG: hypothetical protein LWY06_19700 [Firmicutes bacterium]|nr:hypothetical protein [Bacillota bacterium]